MDQNIEKIVINREQRDQEIKAALKRTEQIKKVRKEKKK